MSELKLTPLHDTHVAAGATMVDFGGWEMPIQYPSGIVAEHLNTRRNCGIFDVSHMGRLIIEGPGRVAFLQKVLSSNVEALAVGRAQYCIIPAPDGSAVDDAYLYRFEEDRYLLVVNASNTDKDFWPILPQSHRRTNAPSRTSPAPPPPSPSRDLTANSFCKPSPAAASSPDRRETTSIPGRWKAAPFRFPEPATPVSP